MGFNIDEIDKRLRKGNRVLCPRCLKGDAKIDDVYGVLPCEKCQHKGESYKQSVAHRRPMTEWEKKKLGWYKNEKSWLEDIRGRKILPNGDVAVYTPEGKLKEIRPKDGGYYGRPDKVR